LQREKAGKSLKVLDGLRFGRLLVIAREGTKHGHAAWLCRCDCGNDSVVLGNHLRAGLTTSCGCFKIEISRLPTGEAAFNAVWYEIKYSAQRRGIGFHLSKGEVRHLLTGPCHYCGQEPSQGKGVAAGKKLNGNFIYNGIDRMDNSRDYTADNVVTCCGVCNKAKLSMTVEEFRAWVKRVYVHFVRGDAR
jgi:hypothetical protein